MPYDLELPEPLKKAGWKVKILDFERLEEPHLTIYRKMRKWRLSLRTGSFLDRGDKWSQIGEGVRKAIKGAWKTLQAKWDRIHTDNPVLGHENDQNDQ